MKYRPDHKAARAILEAILKELPILPEEAAADIALAAFDKYKSVGGSIKEPVIAFLIGPAASRPDAGRPTPGKKTWADLLKEPEHAEKIEHTIAAEVQRPRDLAALVEAMSRRKLLNNEAGNGADVIRAAADIIGESRAGSAKNLRENRQRYTTKETGKITYFLGLLANLGL